MNDFMLSPDGTSLAYTGFDPPAHDREIALLDLTTLKTTVLDTCNYCYGPVWSPDGKHLLYNAMKGNTWNIKLLDRESGKSDFYSFTDSSTSTAPQWSADSKKIILQTMSSVIVFNLNGDTIRKVDLADIDTALIVSGETHFLLTAKEDKLIFDASLGTDTTEGIVDEDGPPSHLYSYDLASKKLTRLDPKGHSCFSPILKGDTIFCGGYKLQDGRIHDKDLNIYSMDLTGANFRMVYKSARYFSCRVQ